MSVMKGLKLSAASKPATSMDDPKLRVRMKTILHILDQKALATAQLEGKEYEPTRFVTRKNEAGERVKEEKVRRVRCDWFTDGAGKVMFQVRYGNKPIELGKGMVAVEVGTLDALPGVIDTLVKAIEAGELDAPLMAAAQERSLNFKRNKAKA